MPANFVPTLIISSFFFNIFKKQTKSHLLGEDDRTKTKNSRKKKIVLYLNVFLMKRCNMMVAEANILASYNIITTTTWSTWLYLGILYNYIHILTLWHLWQIIALEMGTNNFKFFLFVQKNKTNTKQNRARVRTHLYVLCTQLTYIHTHVRRLDTWFFRETKIHILQLVIKYLNRATYIYLYQIFSVLFSEMKMSLSINNTIMCFCVREKKWTNKQKIIINFAIYQK